MKSYGDKLVAFMTAIVIISVTHIKAVSVPELVFNDTKFRFFASSPSIDWDSAQTNCESGGGNLATIKSLKEDTILGQLTDKKDYFSCWIGLNDEANEAGTNASAFVWTDGSNSAYRNFEMFPSDTSGSNCVAYRYIMNNGVISNGWQNLDCDQLTNCSYCAKQESSMGCDLIYDGSCYRAFEVSGGINWLDAQSSCAVWGGDLTSVGILRDQVLLNQYIPNSVGECWIGLHDRDGYGTFQWVDGTAVSYTRWDTNEPSVITTDRCVELSSASDRNWKSISCDVRKNSFICEINANSLTTTEYRFGELIDGGLNFNLLTGNTFLYDSHTLACEKDVNSAAITWRYSIRADLSSIEVLTATYMSTQTGVSWLSVENTKQGYYQCYIDSTNRYTVGVYDTQKTTVAVTGTTYTYTVGVDRDSVLLLCDPMDSSVTLSALKWVVQNGPTFSSNPININSLKDHLSDQSTKMYCTTGAPIITHIFIIIKAPKMTIIFGSMIYGTFFSVSPSVYHFGVPLSTKDMTISINLEGKWNLPDNTDTFNSQLTISNVTSHDAGLYKFYITNWDGAEQCGMQLRLYATIPGNLEKSVTFGGLTYGYFTTTERMHWLISQLNCVNWGGNLVTIDSKQVDSLLYYLTSSYTCWIGLNDRDNEAENNGSTFVWVDGSTSTYRQWDTVYNNEPDGNTNAGYDCVSFRYQDGAASGWDDRECYANIYCYFCQKSGDSRGCDLIYDGSCYRAFEVSDGINWLDAQSSCAVWGGDLTSITTERENSLLYTAISDTVSNSWIGLYERDGDGVYQWVDGTALSYTNWTGSAPTAGSTNDCVQMNTIGAGNWIAADCEGTSNSFICKKPSTNTDTTGYLFGELIDQGLNFRPLTENIFLYNSTILACKGDVNSASIAWQYSVNADLSSSEVLTATYMSTQTGVSWLSVNNTKQGYYQCYIDSTNRYTVGVYDTQKTTVASEGILYQYIVGIDREDVLLLCDPMDSMYNLSSLSWHVNGDTFSNPFIIFSARNSLPVFSTEINCISNSATILTSISIYVPEITVTYSSSNTMRFNTLFPGMNAIPLIVEIEDVSISVNTTGRWKLQNGTYVSSSTVSYPILKYEYFGLYQFYVINWDGDEVCVIQITIVPEEYSTTNSISLSNSETIQNGSTIVITDDSSMINCIISNPDYSVEWFYISQLGAVQTNVTSSSTFSAGTGISTLNVYSNEPGYYSCVINTDIIYSFFVADRDLLIEIPNFDSPSQQISYTVGSTNSLLYYSEANIPDSSLRWTADTVTDGTDTQYSIEYANPVLLSTVFSDVGAGVQTFSCFYRMSPVTLVGSLQLAIRDKAGIRISFEGYNTTFSDVTNTFFPSPQQIRFQEYTENITFTCSLDECVWLIQLVNSKIQTLTMPSYKISSFTKMYEGNYSLLRTTNSGKTYTTAQLFVNLITVPTQQSASLPFIPIIIVVLVIICIIILIIVLIPICIKIFGNKRELFHSKQFKNENTESPLRRGQHNTKGSKISQSNIIGSGGCSGYENLAKIQSPAEEYIELSVNTNVAEYMTIDETSMLPLDIETKVHNVEGPYYSNLANKPSDGNYEQIKENSEYMELNQSEPYERYTPMSAVKEKTKFVAKYIPSKDFPATYQLYVISGMEIESLFSVEFQALNEESKKNIEPESDEARKVQNMRKNPLKNILPYDENRVVLDSPYFECNYINASWLENSQFIASIHPTVDTLQDFLQMIYQTEASMVIMLTTRKEKAKIIGGVSNRVCYWPKKDKPLKCEPFATSLISSTETSAFVKQEISLKNTLEGKDHSFTHCISPIWNEDGTVVEMALVIALLNRIMKQKQDSPNVPIIIHCTDGIAKTGIIMTALNSIKELNARKSINIFNAVKNLRKQRNNMIPTLACYSTCYSLLNEYCSIHL